MQNDTPFPEKFKAVIRKEFPELQPAVFRGASNVHSLRSGKGKHSSAGHKCAW